MLIICSVIVNCDIQDEQATIRKSKEKSDIREQKRVYDAYGDYFMLHDKTLI